MVRNKALGAVNLFFCLLYGYLFYLNSGWLRSFPFSATSFMDTLQVLGIVFFFLIIITVNAVLAYKLLTKKDKLKQGRALVQTLVISFAPFFWAVLYFFGFVIAVSLIFPLTMLVLSGSVYYFLQRYAKKTAIYIFGMTMLITLLAITFNFEESYCEQKGNQAAGKDSGAMTQATAADERALNGWGVKKGQSVGVAFRAHMLCHQTFNWSTALQETYLR